VTSVPLARVWEQLWEHSASTGCTITVPAPVPFTVIDRVKLEEPVVFKHVDVVVVTTQGVGILHQ